MLAITYRLRQRPIWAATVVALPVPCGVLGHLPPGTSGITGSSTPEQSCKTCKAAEA